jgi:hypothetical protein
VVRDNRTVAERTGALLRIDEFGATVELGFAQVRIPLARLMTVTYGLRDMDGHVVEVCDQCGFDARFTHDVPAALDRAIGVLHDLRTRPQAARRPAPEGWSAAEYGDHVVDGVNRMIDLVTTALARRAPAPVHDLPSARVAAAGLARSLSAADLRVPCPFEGAPTDVGLLMLHLLHDTEHHVLDARQGLASLALAASAAVYPAA